MGKSKKAVLHDAGGKKILHPAEADRKKAKQRLRENRAKNRKKRFEAKMLEKDTSLVQAEITEFKELEKKGKLTKWKKDKMEREVATFGRLKDQVEQNTQKRFEDNLGDQFYVDFDELKVHRKASIFYDPVKNPYGAPPQGQVLMYRHPDGSVKREPPPLAHGSVRAAMTDGLVPGHSDMVLPNLGPPEDEPQDGESGESEDEEDDEEDDDEPMLPTELPDGTPLPPGPPVGPAPMEAPLPPGPPPGPSLPPLPPGAPPTGLLPPMPPGPPPGCGGGLPPGFPGPSSGPPGPPPMPKLPCFGGGLPQSQADFAQQMMNMGFIAPPGPPPKGPPPEAMMKQRPPGPPNAGLQKVAGTPPGPPPKNPSQGGPGPGMRPPGPPPKVNTGELPKGAKPPPPPPKTAAGAAGSAAPATKPLNAATRFMPTTLKTKKPSQVAGGVLQASSASLSQDARKRLLFTEAPKVAEKVNIEDAFQDFMGQLDD